MSGVLTRWGLWGACSAVLCFGLLLGDQKLAQASPADSAGDRSARLLKSLRPTLRVKLTSGTQAQWFRDLPLYELDLEVDPQKSEFVLVERAHLRNHGNGPVKSVAFRLYANARAQQGQVPPVRLRKGSCLPQPCAVAWDPSDPSVVLVTPDQPVAPGQPLQVKLQLSGRLRSISPAKVSLLGQSMDSLARLGAGESEAGYGLLSSTGNSVSLANFYAVLAADSLNSTVHKLGASPRSKIGDFSGPVAHFIASVKLPPQYVVVSNGTVDSQRIVIDAAGPGHHLRDTRLTAALSRDFAIVAARDFQHKEKLSGGVLVRSYFQPKHRAAGESVLDAATVALNLFQRRFGPYPRLSLDLAEASLVGGAGGMEFCGMATIASMFYDDGSLGGLLSGGNAKKGAAQITQVLQSAREFVVVHEVAHQWWHGLVGSDSRAAPFLDEALAQFSTVLYFEERYGKARAQQVAEQNLALAYQMMRAMGQPDAAVAQSISSFKSSITYAGIVYGKGPYFFAALRKELGEKKFFRSLRRYADNNRFAVADEQDLLDALSIQHDRKRIEALSQHWLHETHGDSDIGTLNLGSMMDLAGGAQAPQLDAEILDLVEDLTSSLPNHD